MLRTEKILVWSLPILAVVFVMALIHLFQLRYESGDVYPPYSSFRTDPLGAKAFYESLHRLRGLKVQRNFKPLDQLLPTRNELGPPTVLFLGDEPRHYESIDEETIKEWEGSASGGSRLVISFAPRTAKPWVPRALEEARNRDAREKKQNRSRPEDPVNKSEKRTSRRSSDPRASKPLIDLVSLWERWGLAFKYEDLPKGERGESQSVLARRVEADALPNEISWRTAMTFEPRDNAWRTIYERDGRPVLLERKLGAGTIVVSADSYFVSNQAMREHRYPELLAWLVGPNSTVVFDETHLGVTERPGVAALARKYRLEGVFAALLALAGLFVWKNSVSFVPSAPEQATHGHSELVVGRDSTAGFINLLRRTIPKHQILSVCFDQWKAAHARNRSLKADKLERVKSLVESEQARPSKERNPVQAYRAISRILIEKSQRSVGRPES